MFSRLVYLRSIKVNKEKLTKNSVNCIIFLNIATTERL